MSFFEGDSFLSEDGDGGGISGVKTGGGSSFTSGAVIFGAADGKLTEDAANFSYASGALSVSADQDKQQLLGRLAASSALSDVAAIAHYDNRASTTAYGLVMTTGGNTEINGVTTVTTTVVGNTIFQANASGLVMGANKFIQFSEGAEPAGSANAVRLYCKDNGSGKTQLMAIFPTGGGVQIAIEA